MKDFVSSQFNHCPLSFMFQYRKLGLPTKYKNEYSFGTSPYQCLLLQNKSVKIDPSNLKVMARVFEELTF